MSKLLKLEGMIFGDLTVIRKHDKKDEYGRALWVCTCSCDTEKEILICGYYLPANKKDNCGCKTKEKQRSKKRKFNTYDLDGDYGVGYTHKGEVFYFDLDDYDKIKEYCWIMHDGYIEARDVVGLSNKNIKMHRLIMSVTDGSLKVDHIYHDKNDNRKSSLRVCTNQENTINHKVSKSNTSGKSGISYRKDTNKWRARIWFDGKCHSLGSYNSYEDAVKIRNLKEKELFKEFRYIDEKINKKVDL